MRCPGLSFEDVDDDTGAVVAVVVAAVADGGD